jgi:hypothetical protein
VKLGEDKSEEHTAGITQKTSSYEDGISRTRSLRHHFTQIPSRNISWLVVSNMAFMTFPSYWVHVIIPTDFHSIIFQRGRSIINQITIIYPLVNVYIAMENHHVSWENPHFKPPTRLLLITNQ